MILYNLNKLGEIMKKILLLLGLLPLFVSCNNSQDPSSAQPSGNPSGTTGATSGSQNEKEEALDVVTADVAANNFTLNATIETVDQPATSVTYAFADKVACLTPVGVDPMYYIINGNSIDGYHKNDSGVYSLVGSSPTTINTFTLDYLFAQMTKETLRDIFKAVKPEDINESSGTYHIDEVILHLDAAKASANMHIDASLITDGLEWPLTNIDFTIKDEHLKTFSAEQCAIGYNSEKGVHFYTEPSKTSMEFSQYGTTVTFENNSDDKSHCFFVKIVLTISLKSIVLFIGGN